MEQLLREKAKKSKYEERILFLGFIDDNKKNILYSNAELLIIPSRSEAMSLVVLEASIFGLKSIFTDKCGLEFLSNKNLGISVPVDVSSIAEAIVNELNSETRIRRNKKLIEYVLENFNWEKISKKYLELFKYFIIKFLFLAINQIKTAYQPVTNNRLFQKTSVKKDESHNHKNQTAHDD